MALDFRDMCEEVLRERGLWGFIALWLVVGMDLIKTAVEDQLLIRTYPTLGKLEKVGIIANFTTGIIFFVFAFTHGSPDWISWVFRLQWIWFALGFTSMLALVGYVAHRKLQNDKNGFGFWLGMLGAAFMIVIGLLIPNNIKVWRLFGSGIDILGIGISLQAFRDLLEEISLQKKITFLSLGLFTLLYNQITPYRNLGLLFEGDGTLFAVLTGIIWILFGIVLFGEQKREHTSIKL